MLQTFFNSLFGLSLQEHIVVFFVLDRRRVHMAGQNERIIRQSEQFILYRFLQNIEIAAEQIGPAYR